MEYLKVKGIDKPFSRLALGTVWFEPQFSKEINTLMDAYVDKGGTVIETGRFYGPTHQAESLVQHWLKQTGRREEIILIDKACHPIITPDDEHHPEYWRVKPDLITEDLYWSLYHTGCDYFDLFMLHRDDPHVPVGPLMDRFEQHREQGLFKAYGVSNWDTDRLEEAMDYCKQKGYQGLSVSSNSFSLAKVYNPRRPGTIHMDENEVLWYEGKDITLMSWASQAVGFLADIWKKDGNTPQWIQDVYFTDENFERLNRAKILAKEKGVEPVNIAVAFVLCRNFPVSALIGCKNVQELDSSFRALDVRLSEKEMDYLCLKTDDFK